MAGVEHMDAASGEFERLQAMQALAKEIRAPIVENAIWLDTMVSDVLAAHFCQDKSEEALFLSMFMGGGVIGFSTKIDLLGQLLKLRYPGLITIHSDGLRALDKVRVFRNRVAHSTLDTSAEGLTLFQRRGDCVRLFYYRDGRKKHDVVTVEDRDEMLRLGTYCVLTLAAITNHIRGDNALHIGWSTSGESTADNSTTPPSPAP